MNQVSFNKLFDFQKKSKIKAGDGLKLKEGIYPFYTSSSTLNKSIDEFIFDGKSLIFGTGGQASIHYCDEKFAVSTDCFVTQPKNSNELFLKYIYYYLSGNIHVLENGFKGAGLKHISKAYISEIKIPLPTLDEQKMIAAILDAADVYRQKTKVIVEKYDELTQSLFLDMFGDPKETKGGHKLEKYCDFFMGGTPAADIPEFYENGNIDWLKGSDIGKEYIYEADYKITELGFNSCNTKTYPKGTIVIGRTGQGKTRGKVGMLMAPMCTNETMIAIIIKNGINPYYLLHNLKNRYKELRSLGGDNQRGGITQTQLKILNIEPPDLNIQNQFAERVQAIEAQKVQAKASLAGAEDLFNSLSQRAFKGELTS